MTQTIRDTMNLLESSDKLTLARLPVKRDDLHGVMSKETIDYHYGKLAKGYVDRYNKGEGDAKFNLNGATLHNIYFGQLAKPSGANPPKDQAADLINRKFGNFVNFKKEVEERAMKIQGSGWVGLTRTGVLQTIPNHDVTGDAARFVLLIDWWEHAWALDYQADKAGYLKGFWSIIDWNVVNERLTGDKK